MKTLFLMILLAFSTSTFANWTNSVEVTDILAIGPEEGNGFMVVVSSEVGVGEANGTCNGTWHYFNAATDKGKMMFSLFLTAKTTNTPVRLELAQAGSVERCAITGVRY